MQLGRLLGRFLMDFGSKMGVLGGSRGSKNRSWEGSWGVLGGSWVPRAKKWVRPSIWTTHLAPKWEAKIDLKSIQRPSKKWLFFWSLLGSTFGAIWYQLGSQNHPKMEPNWCQNRCKLGCWFHTCFWMDLGSIFVDFSPQHAKAGVPKIYKKLRFFNIFMILLACLLDGFWSQLSSILGWFWEPSWQQVGTKSLQTSI